MRRHTAIGSTAITVEPEPAEHVQSVVLDGLRAYNREYAGPPEFRPLTLAARTSDGEIVGGLVGETGWSWLHVSLLWIAPTHRRHGIGTALLRAAEQQAVERGCEQVFLDTFDFQAREFYERDGYVVFGVQEDYPPGHRRFYLRKALGTPTPTTPDR